MSTVHTGIAFIFSLITTVLSFQRGHIEHLKGFPGHRSIKLSWRYTGDINSLIGFQVQYKEVDIWRSQVYHRRDLMLDHSQMTRDDTIFSSGNGYYQATLYHLRADTKYQINISPSVKLASSVLERFGNSFDRAPKDFNNWITVSTLPFSATVTQCAKDEAVIKVFIGKKFGGKIGVTDVHKKGCYVIGDRANIGNTINFTINFERCGAIRNGSSIISNFVVQENAIVMTETDKQFIVNCSYAPAFLVVSASINMPIGEDGNEIEDEAHKHLNNVITDEKFTYSKYKENNFRKSKMLADQDALISSGTIKEIKNLKAGSHAGQIAVTTFLVIASLFGLFGILYWVMIYQKKSEKKIAELSDRLDEKNLVFVQTDVATSSGIIPAPQSDISLVSMKDISEA